MTNQRQRLRKDDWITEGLNALSLHGHTRLKAEPLSRQMKTTKGSFYWHFKDLQDFHTSVLTRWKELSLSALADQSQSEATPVARLTIFAESLSHPQAPLPAGIDTPVRAWAHDHHTATDVVASVDQAREQFLAGILRDLDLPNPDFVHIVHSALIGFGTLSTNNRSANQDTISTLLAALLALRDA
ncbi:TetR/AcrR family transcriptional regulator [Aliiroseovarius sp. S253]|uniref:TetR/AcrR family transcriptional regulator n=1 Tax=Aliiroseovarius sp. S253 TaxID=3415133 RepID=UPI003C7CAF71